MKLFYETSPFLIIIGGKSGSWMLNWKQVFSDVKVSTGANSVLLCTPVVRKGLGFFALKAFSISFS